MPLPDDVTIGFTGRERVIIKTILLNRWHKIAEKRPRLIPKKAKNYARGISDFTGIPLDSVLKSAPVKKYYLKTRR